MTLEEYRIWIEELKKAPITDASKKEIEKAMRFSRERFARAALLSISMIVASFYSIAYCEI